MSQIITESPPIAKFLVRPFLHTDTYKICSWVTTPEKLLLVSGDIAGCLTPEILKTWLEKARTSLVISSGATDEPVGFCTLSQMEISELPAHYIELCHLLVDPEFKYLFIGPRLVRAAKSIARSFNRRFLCGRIVPVNRWGLALAKHVRAQEFTGAETWTPPGFRWFRLDLRRHREHG